MKNFSQDFLIDKSIVFLNHGSFGATPRPVFETYQRWQREMEYQPVEFLGRKISTLLADARDILADYLHTQRDNLVFVTNATIGLNIVAHSLNLTKGDEVLASDHEYGALDRTWRYLSQKHGFEYRNQEIKLPVLSSQQIINQLWQGITPKTRVIFLSHITSPTAIIFPIKEICAKARQENILTVIDGAHAPGQIPLDLDDLGADFYCGNLHKWLCAPKGAAFLYAHPTLQHLIEPLVISWGWESLTPGPSRFVDLLEWQGTRDVSAFLSVPDAIRYQEQNNWPRVRTNCHALAQRSRNEIQEITGLQPICPERDGFYAQMFACSLPPFINADKLKSALYDQYQIEVPVIMWKDSSLIRVSIQAYNTVKDTRALHKALNVLLKS